MPLFNLTQPFLEKNIEQAIFDNRDKIHDRGFVEFYENTCRQFVTTAGKIIDLFTYEEIGGRFYGKIIELKRGAIDEAALAQVVGYLSEMRFLASQCYAEYSFECVLAGTSIAGGLMNISFKDPVIHIFKYSFEIDGVFFTKHEPGSGDLAIWKAEHKK